MILIPGLLATCLLSISVTGQEVTSATSKDQPPLKNNTVRADKKQDTVTEAAGTSEDTNKNKRGLNLGYGYNSFYSGWEGDPTSFSEHYQPHHQRQHHVAEKHTHTHTHEVKTITKKVPVPYPVTKYEYVPYAVEKKVPYPVHVEKKVPVIVEKKVPVIVEKKIPYPVDRPVHKYIPYPVEKRVPYPVHVEKKVPVPYPVEKFVPYPVEKKVPYPVPVQVPVEKHVPYPVPVEKKIPVYIPVPVHKPEEHQYQHHHQHSQDDIEHGLEENIFRQSQQEGPQVTEEGGEGAAEGGGQNLDQGDYSPGDIQGQYESKKSEQYHKLQGKQTQPILQEKTDAPEPKPKETETKGIEPRTNIKNNTEKPAS